MEDNLKVFRELERFVYHHKPNNGSAMEMIATLVGVCMGIKPAGAVDFLEKQASATDLVKFREIITRLGLKLVTDVEEIRDKNGVERYVMLYVARETEVARELANEFEVLRDSMDKAGQIKELERWTSATRKIGRLLGYPESAVEAFIREMGEWANNMTGGVHKRKYTTVGGPNRYYAHSLEHEQEEFEIYDRLLNQAIEKWTPFTAERLRENKAKRWLEFKN